MNRQLLRSWVPVLACLLIGTNAWGAARPVAHANAKSVVPGQENAVLTQAPNVPPPIARKALAKVVVHLEVRDVIKRLTPNTELAHKAGLPVENGILVDEFLKTTNPNIFAAGVVAAFHNPALGVRIRVEHGDNANTMGRLAGRNMAELGYEAVGELDARLAVAADWKDPFHEGTLCYHQANRLRGVLLWNVWNQVDAARELIASKQRFDPEKFPLQDRLPAAA